MGFSEAIRTCLHKYVDFKGRARRSEYWYWVLFTVIVSIVAGILDSALDLKPILFADDPSVTTTGPFEAITSLALFLPGLAVAVRRLHDRDKSGWWILLNLIFVIGSLILLFGFYIKDSVPGANRFGPNPKGVEGATPGGYAAYDPGTYGQPGQQYQNDPQNPYGQQPFDPQNPNGDQRPDDQPPSNRPPQQ